MTEVKYSYQLIAAASQNIKEKEYWQEKLAGKVQKTSIPFDFKPKDTAAKTIGTRQEILEFQWDQELYTRLSALSKGVDYTLHIILAAGLTVLLHRWTNATDILIGTPIYQQEQDIEFINTVLVLRNQINESMTFKELLMKVRQNVMEVVENQNYPFPVLADQLAHRDSSQGNPLFDIALLLENIHFKKYLDETPYHILFSFLRTPRRIEAAVQYNPHLYRRQTIERMAVHFKRIMETLLEDVNLRLETIDLLTQEEREQVLLKFNRTVREYPGEKSVHQLFEALVEKIPNHTALIGPTHLPATGSAGAEMVYVCLTYKELNQKSNRLASLLRKKGVRPDTIVAVMLEPGIEMIAVLWGILKADGAYLPIEPASPQERIDYMLKDSKPVLFLTASTIEEAINRPYQSHMSYISPGNLPVSQPPNFHLLPATSLAYVIYTSGTTGRPKGVPVEHRNLNANLFAFNRQFEIKSSDTMIQLTSYTFDAFVEELYPVLLQGGRLAVPHAHQKMNLQGLGDFIRDNAVNIIDCTPLLLNQLNQLPGNTLKSVHTFISGGDVLKESHVSQLLKIGKVYNTYGPTETTVCAAYYWYSGQVDNTVPIGSPISNYHIFILDDHMRLLPIGIIGEIGISGPGVTRGYLNRPGLTAEKFCLRRPGALFEKTAPGPRKNFSLEGLHKDYLQSCNHAAMPSRHSPHSPYSPIYHTGDLGRWLPDGNIDFFGRKDRQVKIRGFRIEIEEIETLLAKKTGIKDAIVTARQDRDGEQYLCAYCIRSDKTTIDSNEIRQYLQTWIPDYMVPGFLMFLDQFPLTPAGKIDQQALPEPVSGTSLQYVPPKDEFQKKLQQIWQEIFDLETIGILNNFFEIGGHSLQAIRMSNAIHQAFQVNITIGDIFQYPTIQELAVKIKEIETDKQEYSPIVPIEKMEYYPLSSAQKRLYILHHIEKSGISYNMPFMWSLGEKTDSQRLTRVFRQLIQKHESLRTSFFMLHDKPVQQVHDQVEFDLEFQELDDPRELNAIQKQFPHPFDLSQAPLLRVELVKSGNERYLFVDMHHIISDGVSHEILIKDLLTLYSGQEPGQLHIQYKDYSHWQQQPEVKETIRWQENYWLKEFTGDIPVLVLPTDHPRPTVQSFAGYQIDFEIPFQEADEIRTMAMNHDATLYLVLQAVFALLMAKLSNQEDIIIGSIIAGRQHSNLEKIIGMFVNTLALRTYPAADRCFNQFLEEVKEKVWQAFENQEYPFEELVEKAAIRRDAGRNPLFDAVFTLQNLDEAEDKKISPAGSPPKPLLRIAKFDITLYGMDTGQNLAFTFEYCTNLFKHTTIERFIVYFKKIIKTIVKNPTVKLYKIEIIPDEEKNQLLLHFNETTASYPQGKTLYELFLPQVEKNPNHLALLGPKIQITNDKQKNVLPSNSDTCGRMHMTYRELNEKAGRLARLLNEKGVQADTIVGIMAERSVEMIIGIIAILKAGGAYLPIDPDYPPKRIDYMLKDSSVEVLLTTPKLQVKVKAELEENFDRPQALPLQFINIERCLESGLEPSLSTLTSTSTCQVSPANLAYIIYTSGTTGKPKGSIIEHRNVVQLMFNDKFQFDFNNHDVWTLFHSYCFDFSVWEMYSSLLYGGKLVLISKIITRDPRKYLEILEKEKVTILNQTPAAFYKLTDQELENPGKHLKLKYVIFGGEALIPIKLKEWKTRYPETKLINMFGITETTVHVTYKEITDMDIQQGISNIGQSIPTLSTYLMDRYLTLVPRGTPGELCVGGKGVCRGYLNQPGLTAEKFIENPYQPGERLYRTGDLAKFAENGDMAYFGRIDHQVKIRGFRVELAEIETQLLQHPVVKEAVVTAHEDITGTRNLAAYILPRHQNARAVNQLVKLEREGSLENRSWYEYPNGMTIFYLNRSETDFMYQEIFESQSYLKHGIALEPGACIFDVGANIGIFSLFIRQICPGAVIYAFEPIPPIFELLSLNTSIYCPNIQVFEYGLSAEETRAEFIYYPHAAVLSGRFADKAQETNTVKSFIKNESSPGINEQPLSDRDYNELLENRLEQISFTCTLKTLSQIIKEKKIDQIDLLKIDVEKGEIDVLNGITESDWTKIRQLVIEVHDIDKRLQTIIHRLETRGYQVTVEQDSQLKNTALYNVYAAAKPRQTRQMIETAGNLPVKPAADWMNPRHLINDIRGYLKTKLPEYMLPSYFVLMERIPLTANGKIDRNALPQPGIKPGELKLSPYMPPTNNIEEKLTGIWSYVLGISRDIIGIDHNFFELGGHSLKATVMASRVHKELNVRIPLAEVFKTPYIKELSKYILNLTPHEYISIQPVEKKEYYVLSSAQKRLYILHQMEITGTAYNIPEFIPINEEININQLQTAFKKLLQRHESLRTSFKMIEDEPVQEVYDDVTFAVEYDRKKEVEEERSSILEGTRGLAPLPGESHPSSVIRHLSSGFVRPFDLSRAPLLRVKLIKTGDRKYLLMVDMHHIISDGFCHEILVRDFRALTHDEVLPLLRLQYKDFSQWQNSSAQREAVKAQENYWINQYAGEIPVLNLPTDYMRPSVQSYEGKHLQFEIPAQDTRAIETIAAKQGVTLYMLLLAVVNILMAKLSSQEDIIIGSPIAGRQHADLQQIIGMFVNSLALRNYPAPAKTFSQFLKEIKHRTLDAFENQAYPFEELVEKVTVNRDISRNPLFDVMFVFQTFIPPTPGNAYVYEDRSAKFDLTITAEKGKNQLRVSIQYSTQLFNKETIERFMNYMKKIIAAVPGDPGIQLGQIEIMGAQERKQVLYDFNDTAANYPQGKTIHEIFQEQVEKSPNHTALVGNKIINYKQSGALQADVDAFGEMPVPGESPGLPVRPVQQVRSVRPVRLVQLTYHELNERSGRLAGLLIEEGLQPDTIIGIIVERSLEMIIGIMGILKAGGAYLPIDPGYPQERINYMLTDSRAKFLVTTPGLSEKFKKLSTVNCQLLMVNEKSPAYRRLNTPPQEANSINNLQLMRNNLAYTIYTSGSTGKPKGVLLQHHSLVNRLNWMQKTYLLDADDTLLQKTTYTFDVSVWEILWWSFTGARLYLLKPDEEKDPALITETIEKNRITIIHFVPSMLNAFLEYLQISGQTVRRLCLRQVIVSGEALTVTHVRRFNEVFSKTNGPKPGLDNLYGPTEATIDVTYFSCPPGKEIDYIPIGKPIDNIQLYVMDKGSFPQPVGIPGELCIAGDGLARGYLNRPGLTAEKFDRDLRDLWDYHDRYHKSHQSYRSNILYRTGDLARWRADGNIEFLGRLDHQVKIRGFRVELGEIEHRLTQHLGVKESVVLPRESGDGQQYLCAYIVSETDGPGEQELKEYLSHWLPDYMVPAFFVRLEQIPLTPNGKIDRNRLPAPEIKPGENYQSPANALEKNLVDIWSEVLEIENHRVSVNDNFFHLGGHSLKATIMTAKIYKRLEVKLPLLEIFKNPTVRKISAVIQKARKTPFTDLEKVEEKEYYPLSFNQERIFVLHQLAPRSTAYNLPGTAVMRHKVRKEKIQSNLAQIIAGHESLRTGFKMMDDQPVQFIIREFEVPFTVIDISSAAGKDQQERRNREYLELAITPFNLEKPPLFRAALLQYGDSHFELMYNLHHIITDGWSMEILRQEFIVLYEGYESGKQKEPEPVELQYKDFTTWHNKQLKSPEGRKSQETWRKKLEKGIPSFEIPGDFSRKDDDYTGAAYSWAMGKELKEQVNRLARHHETSVFMVLFSLYLLLLSRFSRQKDIACSIIDANREHPALHKIIGFFVNAVIFHTGIEENQGFSDFLQRVHREVMTLFQHQWYPLELVCTEMKIPYPGVPVSFNMLNQQEISRELEVRPAPVGEHTSAQDIKFDLEPYITEYKNDIRMYWVYKKNLYHPQTIEYMVTEYMKMALFFTTHPAKSYRDYRELDRKGISREKASAVKKEYREGNLVQAFENQVIRTPDHIAVKQGEEAFTYAQLNRSANRSAHLIRRHPALQRDKKENRAEVEVEVVGLLLDHGYDMLVSLMGTLKAGCAYLPLSPDYPKNRLLELLNHSGASLLITRAKYEVTAGELAKENQVSYLTLENIQKSDAVEFDRNPGESVNSQQLTYLIYTSGSTGTPKGVMQIHQNVIYYMKHWKEKFSITPRDRVTLLSSFVHDASIPDIFATLLNGAALYPFDVKGREQITRLSEFLEKEGITLWHSVASLFGYVVNTLEKKDRYPEIRYIILGGEAVRANEISRYKQFFPSSGLVVVYGQSESTVNSFWQLSQPQSFHRPLLGEVLEETEIFVVDEQGRQVEPYETGEIVVASSYVSPGYWKNETASKKAFTTGEGTGKLYYTGDLGRLLPGKCIEFYGRKDTQVKIRGYRIEPGEIESRLLQYPGIKEAVVTARESETQQTGDRYLCAYVVSEGDITSSSTQAELRNYLSGYLPAYMVPVFFVRLERMPLTATGKIDRAALPASIINDEPGYAPPANDIEQKVAQVWQEVLKLERVGITTSFFNIGGNSINILQVNTRLRREFQTSIPLVKMFQYPTIQGLVRYLEQLTGSQGEHGPDAAGEIDMEKFEAAHDQSLDMLNHTMQILETQGDKETGEINQ